jgi:hypothetical protein
MNERLAGYVAYFEQLALQPTNHWNGFESGDPGAELCDLHSQIAFACYALAIIAMYPDSETEVRDRCRTAMGALIERMFQRRIWAYWASAAEQGGRSADPVAIGNGAYSGPLAMMIGAFEAIGGDRRFDDEFRFFWTSAESFHYTHTTLVEALWQQMRANPHYAISGRPGRIEILPMAQALWALELYDAAHHSDYAAAVRQGWWRFLKSAMVFNGPRLPGRGAFSAAYFPRMRLALPYGTLLNDAAALALLAPLELDSSRQLADRLLPRIKQMNDAPAQAFVPGYGRNPAPTSAIATGFAYVLAVELGDEALASALLTYAEAHFDLTCDQEQRYFAGPAPAAYLTALFAIGEAGGFEALKR